MAARRVLHACDWHLKYATGLSRGMADAGHEVTLLTREHDLEFGGAPGAMRAYIAGIGGGAVTHRVLPGRVLDRRALRAVGRAWRASRRHPVDVVHVQDGIVNDPRLLLVARARWRRYALTVHDPTPHPGDRPSLANRVAGPALVRGAGLVFVHSETLKDELIARWRPRAPVAVVPHGMPAPNVSPLPERPSLLFFGRIATYYKGLDVLLDAMPRVWEKRPEVTLTIAGSGDLEPHPVTADPRVVVRNEHVSDDELPALFAAATCCVLPYRQASQSGVGSQAKAYGRAIVASDVGGLPDLVGPDSGRLVPPGEPAALADALIEVVGSPGLAQSMSDAAVAWVEEAGWQRVAERTVAAYEEHLL